VAAALTLTACGPDLGARGTDLLPAAEARTRPAPFWTYHQVNPQAPLPFEGKTNHQFTLGNQRFIVQFPRVEAPPNLLKTVGSVEGANVYAPVWAQPPFDWVAVGTDAQLQMAVPFSR
jgi:hypothetical protein